MELLAKVIYAALVAMCIANILLKLGTWAFAALALGVVASFTWQSIGMALFILTGLLVLAMIAVVIIGMGKIRRFVMAELPW